MVNTPDSMPLCKVLQAEMVALQRAIERVKTLTKLDPTSQRLLRRTRLCVYSGLKYMMGNECADELIKCVALTKKTAADYDMFSLFYIKKAAVCMKYEISVRGGRAVGGRAAAHNHDVTPDYRERRALCQFTYFSFGARERARSPLPLFDRLNTLIRRNPRRNNSPHKDTSLISVVHQRDNTEDIASVLTITVGDINRIY
ncbi:hypothetical protein EVAR_37907_1 [Eumeta japonica]|uniref:Uncharacterized protein n=1 Tax=Eumeta variegata TaxID=151549 RepID=A0A4C1XGQ0_EUMVA|nr:hypothetical protein EVAR_37907_1 [Eumeta japonica]